MLWGGSIQPQGWMWGYVPRRGLLQRFVSPQGWGRPQGARETHETLPLPLVQRGHWGCWVPRVNFKPWPKHHPSCSASDGEAGRGQAVK